MAVTKTLRSLAGRKSISWMEPLAATLSISSGVASPEAASAASK
jgi:hypothetical protein